MEMIRVVGEWLLTSLPSEFLIILRNSPNSIFPDPSSSTKSIISCTSSLVSAKPKPMRGSSNCSTPIEPVPVSSSESKHSYNFWIYLQESECEWVEVLTHLGNPVDILSMITKPFASLLFLQIRHVLNEVLPPFNLGHEWSFWQLQIQLYILSRLMQSYIILITHIQSSLHSLLCFTSLTMKTSSFQCHWCLCQTSSFLLPKLNSLYSFYLLCNKYN